LEKTEVAIKNGQSRDTGNTGQTKNRLKTAKKNQTKQHKNNNKETKTKQNKTKQTNTRNTIAKT
jgi:hypothetical protein